MDSRIQDSVVGDDPTLPVDFDASNNLAMLPNVTMGPPDISNASGSLDPMADGSLPGFQNASSGRMSPIRPHTMKDYEQQISELKKENFSLKLRIYFMEERLQPNFEENDDIKTNIELKVEIESLKRDLMDNQQLLVKASNAVESLVQEKEAIAEKLKEENKKALEQLRERLQEENVQSKKEVKELNEAMKKLQKQLEDAQQQTEDFRDSAATNADEQARIQELEDALKKKDDELDHLHELEDAVKRKDEELQKIPELQGALMRIPELEDVVRRKNVENEELLHKQHALVEDLKSARQQLDNIPTRDVDDELEKDTRLKDLEAASQDKDKELEEKDALIKELEDDLGKANKDVKDLKDDLTSKETTMRTQESNAMKRDKAIQGLTEMIRSKEKEIKKLCDQIDGKEAALSDAKEAVHRAEKIKYEGIEQYQASMADMDTKLDEAKAALHRKELENQRLQRAVARKTDELDKLRLNKSTADAQTDELLEDKNDVIKDLKEELNDAKGQADDRMDALKDHYQGLLDDGQKQLQVKEQAIKRLTKGLQEKDEHIKEYMELARNMHRSPHEENDGKELVIQSLRDRLKQRDKAVEDAIEEKFQVAEEKDAEVRKLKVALREKDRNLEKANGELLGAEDKINSLEDELQDKDAKNKQLKDANRSYAKAKREADQGHQQALQDKDALIGKLHNALTDKDKTIDGLQDAQSGGGKGRDDTIGQLSERIREKDKFIQEIIRERDQMAKAGEKEVQDLLETLRAKDDQIKELHDRHNRMMANKNDMLKEMQRQMDDKEYEIQGAENTLAQAEQEQGSLLNKMRNALAEKDKTIEKLLASNQEKDRLFWELQQAADKSSPQSPELVSAERMRLTAELAQAKKRLAEKQALIDELTAMGHPQLDNSDSLKDEIDNKNRLLAKAKSTIDALQRDQKAEKQLRADMSKLRRQNIELQSELQAKQDHIDALIHAGKVKDNIIQELRLQDPAVPVRNEAVGRESSNTQLQQALMDHLAELSNLSDALKAERQLYVNITQNPNPVPNVSTQNINTVPNNESQRGPSAADSTLALDIELSAVQALRKQLEEGIKRNKEIRNNLLKQQESSNSNTGNQDSQTGNQEEQAAEIQALRDQLEETRRWNASLQMRLDEMKQRADGVGSDVEPVVHTMPNDRVQQASSEQDGKVDTGDEMDDVRRGKPIDDGQDLESVRSIPGQEMPTKKVSTGLQKQVEDLQSKLDQSEAERNMLTQQLEAVMLNPNQSEADGGPVVPILKQQLDQAKTLLMQKDRKLQEKEQQNQALRHHLGIGPSSPITPGRSMMAGLSQENTRLQHELQEAKTHNQNLEHHLQGMKAQCIKMKKVNEALQKQLENMAKSTSSDDERLVLLGNELDEMKSKLQNRVQAERELRQALGLAPDEPIEDGRNMVDRLHQENGMLRKQIDEVRKDLDDMQAQLDQANKELEDRSSGVGQEHEAEIKRLKKQLGSAEKLNELLKRHIELNSASDGNQSFNPELIVDMAKEIEKLQEQLDRELGVDHKDEGRRKSPIKDKATIAAYKKSLRQVEEELDEAKQKMKTLQRKLQATEGTVHRQADKIKQYRRQMHNAGIAPPGTPKRFLSDSNLLQSAVLPRNRSTSNLSTLSVDSGGSTSSLSSTQSEQDVQFNDFGSTDDVTELKEQVGVLKNQLQRLRRAIRHLQRRLRATEGSRSPSPSRSMNDSWFEFTANQDAFDKMRLELDNLRDQLNQTNVANMTLQETNIGLSQQLMSMSFDMRSKHDKMTQTKPGMGNQSLDVTKEEQLKKLSKELQERKNLNKKLRDLLAENQKMAEETGRDLERLAKEVEDKNTTISTLRKQLRQVRSTSRPPKATSVNEQVNHSSRTRSHTIPGSDKPPDNVTPSDTDEPDMASQFHSGSNAQYQSRTYHRTRTVQTDQWSNPSASGDESSASTRTEISHLKTKLRETERLNKTLKTELEIYRKVLDGQYDGSADPRNERTPHDPNDVLSEHLEEIRALRKRLEESINVNDRLREQLEAKLAGSDQEESEGTTNIHLYQTNIELKEENNTLNEHIREKEHIIRQLTEETTKNRIKLQRMTTENQRLKEQLEENVHLADSLRFELNVYEQLQQKSKDGASGKSTPTRLTDPTSGIDLTELLREIRHLRIQLERSIDTNNALRQRLEEMMSDRHGAKSSPTTTYNLITTEITDHRRDSTAKRKLFKDTESSSYNRTSNQNNSTEDRSYNTRQDNGNRGRSHTDPININRSHVTRQDFSDRSQVTRQDLSNGDGSHESRQGYHDRLHVTRREDRTDRSHVTRHDPSDRLHSTRSYQYNHDIGAEIEEPQFYSIPPGHGGSNIHIPSNITNGAAAASHIGNDGDTLYALCTLATYNAIHHSITEGCALAKLMETKLSIRRGDPMSNKKQQELLNNIKFLLSHLEECSHHLTLFWKNKLPQTDDMVAKLKKRLMVQEKTMRDALEKLSATNRMKVGMEQAIIDQLAMTHTVLRQARGNLEAQPQPRNVNSD